MPESSPYQVPASIASPTITPGQHRPTGVTVFGILSIVLGLLGVVGIFFTVGMMVFGAYIDAGPNPIFDAMKEHQGYRIFFYVSTFIGAIFTVLLVAAGIGMLKMKPWSRKLSVVYSLYAIVSAIVGLVVNVAIVFWPSLAQATAEAEKIGAIAGLVSMVVGSLVGLVYPIALLIYCWRRQTIAAFEG